MQKKFSAQEVQELVKGKGLYLSSLIFRQHGADRILMAQELETLAVEYENNLMIVKVDTDEEYEFAQDMQVRGLPTLFFIPGPKKDAIRTKASSLYR